MKQIQKGFTLIELMIVVAIIGILAAVAIPAYQDYIVKAKLSKAVSTLDPVKTALAMYFQEQGGFPNTALAVSPDYIGSNVGAAGVPDAGTTVVGSSWASLGFGNYPNLPKEVASMALYSSAGTNTSATNICIVIQLTNVKAGTVDGAFVSISPFQFQAGTTTPIEPASFSTCNLTTGESISGASAINWYYGCNKGNTTQSKTDSVVRNFFKNGNTVLTCV